jgi:hypothetical protein
VPRAPDPEPTREPEYYTDNSFTIEKRELPRLEAEANFDAAGQEVQATKRSAEDADMSELIAPYSEYR